MNVVIRYTDYLISRNRISVEEFTNHLSEEYIKMYGDIYFSGNSIQRSDLAAVLEQVSKIKSVCVEERKNEPDMFKELLDKYIKDEKTNLDEIDYIIYTKGTPVIGDSNVPYHLREINTPYYLQKEYNIKNTTVFCIEQECAATLIAFKLAASLIKDNSARRVLILASNFMENYEQRLMGLFPVSDGIGIMELAAGEHGLSYVDFKSIASGSISRIQDFTHKADEVVEVGVNLIKSLLDRNNLTMKDISLIIPQNTNSSAWNIYSKHFDISKEKVFFDNFGDVGHLGDVDMVRNIHDISNKRLLSKNEFTVAYSLGTGTAWNALLLKEL